MEEHQEEDVGDTSWVERVLVGGGENGRAENWDSKTDEKFRVH